MSNLRNENDKDELQASILYNSLLDLKKKDVNLSSLLLIILTFSVGIVKLFTAEQSEFFIAIGKSLMISDVWIGIFFMLTSLLFMISLKKPKFKKVSIKRISIIATTCAWTYLLFEYLLVAIFIKLGIAWIAIIGIIAICFYVMVRGDYE